MLVRDAAHITPYNFDSCVHTIRVFVEASMHNLAGNCSLLGYYRYHYLSNTDPSSGSRLWFPAEFVALYHFNTQQRHLIKCIFESLLFFVPGNRKKTQLLPLCKTSISSIAYTCIKILLRYITYPPASGFLSFILLNPVQGFSVSTYLYLFPTTLLSAAKKRPTTPKHKDKRHRNKKDHGANNKSSHKSKKQDPFGQYHAFTQLPNVTYTFSYFM